MLNKKFIKKILFELYFHHIFDIKLLTFVILSVYLLDFEHNVYIWDIVSDLLLRYCILIFLDYYWVKRIIILYIFWSVMSYSSHNLLNPKNFWCRDFLPKKSIYVFSDDVFARLMKQFLITIKYCYSGDEYSFSNRIKHFMLSIRISPLYVCIDT